MPLPSELGTPCGTPCRTRARLINALFALLAACSLGGCWEWSIFVPEDPNVCGDHVPPVTGPLTVVNFTLIDAASKSTVVGFDPIPPNAIFNLATLPARLNIRANTTPAEVGGVLFTLDGKTASFEVAPPYMLAGDQNCGDYNDWKIPAAGLHTLTGIAIRTAASDGERGGTATLSFTIN